MPQAMSGTASDNEEATMSVALICDPQSNDLRETKTQVEKVNNDDGKPTATDTLHQDGKEPKRLVRLRQA
jgi:hypothetical protein